jgi:hypothetical protein
MRYHNLNSAICHQLFYNPAMLNFHYPSVRHFSCSVHFVVGLYELSTCVEPVFCNHNDCCGSGSRQTIFSTVLYQNLKILYKILPFQCQKYHYFPENFTLIFYLFVTFYVGSGTVMHFGSGSANAKSYGSCVPGSTTRLRIVPMLIADPCNLSYSGYGSVDTESSCTELNMLF